ncbi:MAG: IS110 family transposase [Acidimicrobiales bacterium]|nr:IS110 family transposase [Acidimicrobiales bacterium]
MTRSSTPAKSTQKRRSPKNPPVLPQATPGLSDTAAETQQLTSAAEAPPTRFVGLDVHKQQITYCILDRHGMTVREGEIVLTRERLAEFASKVLRPTDHAALESTTNCWVVVDVLQQHVANVVVSNPLATKAIAYSKIKTDKVDAKVLAQLLRCDFLPTVWQPDAATRLRRQLSGRRASLVGQRTRLQNRIHSVLAMRLIIPPAGIALFGTHGVAWLKSLLEDRIDADGALMIASDLRQLESVQEEIDLFDKRLADLAWEDQRVKLLLTIPGISVVIAQALVAAFGDISRFKSGDAAASYLGLTPSTRQSATSVYHGPITKQGNSTARYMLVQAAQQYSRQPGPLGHFFQRLRRRRNHNVAVVATARKLAVIAWRLLTTGEPYRYAQPRSTTEKLARLRVAATGEKRRGGCGKGVKPEAILPGGGRSVRSLDEVYENEGLPARSPLPTGEVRHLKETETLEFAEKISAPQRVPRKSNATTKANKQRPATTRSYP